MKKIISFLFLFQFVQLFAQTGGTTTYSLLNLGYSARANALGTDFISVKDQDVNLGVSNPS
ncbi:MAG: penicillin-binding protein, partial [Fluviicola sp.]|nr:penicillin-binding protein [Fluviicola sp.]